MRKALLSAPFLGWLGETTYLSVGTKFRSGLSVARDVMRRWKTEDG
jgi:hypothetical protein